MRLVKSFVKYFAPLPLELAQIRCWGIVLVLVVVLDWWASAGKGGHYPPAIILFRYDGRKSRILEPVHEQEAEHELLTSVFGFMP